MNANKIKINEYEIALQILLFDERDTTKKYI